MKPIVLSGKFSCGVDCTIGHGVTIDVAEEVVLGDRCVVADGTYFCGRRVTVGDDFFGYAHPGATSGNGLQVGRGRIDCEFALLEVGNRCTLHNNRIDLARWVKLGDDVGLSPDVAIYTHGYWMNPLEGFPQKADSVVVECGSIIGFRSVLLPGAGVPAHCVVGAQSVVNRRLSEQRAIYAGNPARWVRNILAPSPEERKALAAALVLEYAATRIYRGLPPMELKLEYPLLIADGFGVHLENGRRDAAETPDTDDLRDFLFRNGVRVYTQRPFRKLPRRAIQ